MKWWQIGLGLGVVGLGAFAFTRTASAASPSGGDNEDADEDGDDGSKASNDWNSPLAPYAERRVKVADFATLASADARLEAVPGQPGRKLHWRAVDGFLALEAAAQAAGFKRLRLASAWRKPAFPSREAYEEAMIKKFGSVKEGAKWKAFASAHETGLAVDFGNDGLEPKRATIPAQLKSPFFAWLRANAYKYGWAPYKAEPWHWEFPIPPADFKEARP